MLAAIACILFFPFFREEIRCLMLANLVRLVSDGVGGVGSNSAMVDLYQARARADADA